MSGEKHWFYQHGGHWFGPVSTQDLKRLAVDGEIAPMDPAWKQGLGSRIRLGQIKDLFTFSGRNSAAKPDSKPTRVAAKDRGPARTYRGPGVPLGLKAKSAKKKLEASPSFLHEPARPQAQHNPFL
jgi:uncharacterized protein DUF4339